MTDSTAPTPTARSLQLAAQAWCTPKNARTPMNPNLAEAFAAILDRELAALRATQPVAGGEIDAQITIRSQGAELKRWYDVTGHQSPDSFAASQPVAEGVPFGWTDGDSRFIPHSMRETILAVGVCGYPGPFTRATLCTIPLYAHRAPAPEGGTLPPLPEGCPGTVMWGGCDSRIGEADKLHEKSEESCHHHPACIPLEIVPAGTRSSLRAADLGRGAAVPLGEIGETGRGFEIIQFVDRQGNGCTLQQSSAADFTMPGSSAVWLGVDDTRMHLSVESIKSLIKHLTSWVQTGSFRAALPSAAQLKGGGDGV